VSELDADVAANVARVRDRIRAAGGDPAQVTIVAVTKRFDADVVLAAVAAGIVDIGESYAQEMEAKAATLADDADDVRWHFVGRLQRNKVRKVASVVSLWQSVDRLELGAEIARWAPGAAVLVQVDISGEPTKGGCRPDAVPALVDGLTGLDLEVRGLMAVGPLGPAEAARPGFRQLRETARKLGLSELSMGMTHDLEVAIEEGSTMVRVGEALFGPRPGSVRVEH
jgi:PLP dependent protein